MIALAQRRPDVIEAIGDRRIVTSFTAFAEFTRSMAAAGPTEMAGGLLVQEWLLGNLVPSIPSPRVANLVETQAIQPPDKLIFGTADALNLQIVTGDGRFVDAAAGQGVILNALVIPPARFTGR